jgi:periplasmic protein TonB
MPRLNVESDAGSPIVTLDLSPIPTAPVPPPDDAQPQADAPPDAQAAPETPVVQAAPPPAPDPIPTPPVALPPAESEPRPDPQPAPSEQVLETPPPPPPTPPKKDAATAIEAPPPAPPLPPSAPSVEAAARAEVAAAPVLSAGREEAISSAALQNWRRDLIAQIERHKRFPAGARGQSGVASVAFSIDRSGRLTDVRIAASSGSASLDGAALDLIRRAQPFPAPPEALPERDLSFVAPVRYLPPDQGR